MSSTSVIKQRIHQAVAESVLNEIQSKQSRYYYFLGKTLNFSTNNVELPESSITYEYETRNNIIALKAINASDVSFVIPRISWQSGTVYDMYDDISDEILTNFYALNEDTFNVYKCLDNNYGSVSTVKPTNAETEPFVTSDGYKWKFMFNIPLAQRNKFLTTTYIPVSNSLRNRFFSNGGIESFSIEAAGQGYTQETTVIIVSGDGSGAIIRPIIQNGKLVDAVIENPGVGYSFAIVKVESSLNPISEARLSVNLSMGDINTPQALTETLSTPGTIDTIIVTDPGFGYSTAPNISIIGDGSGCTAIGILEQDFLKAIQITNPGSNYTTASVIIQGNAKARPIISPLGGHGRDSITELRSRTLMFYSTLSSEKLVGFDIDNDYRQFGIIRNPKNNIFSSRIVDTSSKNRYNVIASTPIDISLYPIGTKLYDLENNEFTVTASQKSINGLSGLILLSNDLVEIFSGMVLSKEDNTDNFIVAEFFKQDDVIAQYVTSAYIVKPVQFNPVLYTNDLILEKNTDEFIVISVNLDSLLLLPKNGGIISPGDIINIKGTETSFTVEEVIEPGFDKKNGDLLFIDNRAPFSQTEDQTVTFRTVIQY
jgi:hypothetical protein